MALNSMPLIYDLLIIYIKMHGSTLVVTVFSLEGQIPLSNRVDSAQIYDRVGRGLGKNFSHVYVLLALTFLQT